VPGISGARAGRDALTDAAAGVDQYFSSGGGVESEPDLPSVSS